MIINMLDVFNFYLMVFNNLKLIVFKILSQFLTLPFFCSFCLNVTELFHGVVPFPCLFLKVILFSFSFICCYFDLVNMFCFFK